ncbi:MAG TPA: NADP-dependent phosphogluconate dehydrogenase [Candidatus Methanoperedens sp.]|nr:NADP-dependent phosphogluconate dehydrogenase [Candidatus Methanoperedens sp.]
MNKIGVIGLSVMGGNLAKNMADNGISVSIYNRSEERTKELIKDYGEEKNLIPFYDLKSFVNSLERPRKVILMIQAGEAVDLVINQLREFLEEGDIIVDGGNSYFKDTIRREKELSKTRINFVGMGISGGEEGARKGPSMMPGGSKEAWKNLEVIFEKIAAKDFNGLPCISYIGTNGAGHFVKMVHNAIEYVDIQLIAEIYWIMKTGLQMSNDEMATVFNKWNKGRLNSYLIEITAKILATKDKNGEYVLDTILDTAGSKGTGKWASLESLELGVPAMSIAMSVFARYISDKKEERLKIGQVYGKNTDKKIELTVEDLEKTLYLTKILAYAQGYELMKQAAVDYEWDLNFKEISRIWQGGCIIRAQFLEKLTEIFEKDIENIILAEYFKKDIEENMEVVRKVAVKAIKNEIPVAEILSAISYFDSLKSPKLPANLIQAQRDFFGAHTFQTEIGGEAKHFDWS